MHAPGNGDSVCLRILFYLYCWVRFLIYFTGSVGERLADSDADSEQYCPKGRKGSKKMIPGNKRHCLQNEDDAHQNPEFQAKRQRCENRCSLQSAESEEL